jgi:TRAP-type transport system periplasmic protein
VLSSTEILLPRPRQIAEPIQEEFKRNRIWPIFFSGVSNFRILCTKPVTNIEHFKNLRIRSYGEHVPKLWASLGAIGVTVLPPEQYDGLQRGNIDCAYFPWDLAYAAKLHEVGKFASSADFGAISSLPIVVNYDLWHSKWSAEVKKLFMEVSRDAVERSHRLVDAAGDSALAAMMKEGGVKLAKFEDQDKINKIAPDFITLWVADMEKKGLGDPARRMGEIWRKRRAGLQ